MIDDPLQLACERAGGRRALAAAIGVTRQAIEQWRRIPAERVLKVEAASGISRHILRPDIFDSATPAQSTPSETLVEARL
ncbi:helix-turn-helix domain-containing protein [Methylobacterium sp. BTF04]|uniref:YdaS family helix-turn-helix protein n=1 Tax=Methylobacterium sp. BTF04 TaxID=2708300 RepID=UPI0013D7B0B9|nr:YdaS family helix-turn-helix protein [Methylobacterium sp. BTF04]NEU13561.1 helix-turn-helix domain-containing protein [Methylobacterium sp. BTF04]